MTYSPTPSRGGSPARVSGYHAQTFGFLLGETVRRATGRTLAECLRELVTVPLGVADDIHFGVPAPFLPRVARSVALTSAPPNQPEPGSTIDRAIPPGVRPDANLANRRDVLTSDIPSAGTMTARGVATMYAALLGHVDSVQLVSARRCREMARVQFQGEDEVMGMETAWAFGYSPSRPGGVPSRRGSTFGMVGTNGSAAYADIDSGVAVALMRNCFGGGLRAVSDLDRIVADVYGPGPDT